MASVTKLSKFAKNRISWGFIGLGNMGYPMAKNLRTRIPETDNMLILDTNQDVTDAFVEEVKEASRKSGKPDHAYQVDVAQSPREMAEKSNIIVTCLPTVRVVQDTFRSISDKGALPPMEQERLFIDCSTIDPISSRKIACSICGPLASQFIDAPMSGGAVGAQAGTLSFMFGSNLQTDEFIDRVKSILLLMGTKVWNMGKQGCGVSAKLANNYILAINNIATSEALNLGRQWGLDPKVLTALISSSTGHCWPIEVNNPVPGIVESAPASNNYGPGCPIEMIHKDLGLAMTGAAVSGSPLLLANTASDAYNAVNQDYRGRDFSVVYQWLQQRSSHSH